MKAPQKKHVSTNQGILINVVHVGIHIEFISCYLFMT